MPSQAACWPPGCSGQDVLGVAEPGSGKTLAYLLPGVMKLQVKGVVGLHGSWDYRGRGNCR